MRNAAAAIAQPLSVMQLLPVGNGLLSRAWRWIRARQLSPQVRRLRVVETVSLGEKRFAAVIHVDGQQFLIGGGPTSVSLLAKLHGSSEPKKHIADEQAAGEQTVSVRTSKVQTGDQQ